MFAEVVIRYGEGVVDLTGWGLFVLVLVAVIARGGRS